MSFDWRTEEFESDGRRRFEADRSAAADDHLDPSERESASRASPGWVGRRTSRLAFFATAILLLAALGGVLYGQIDRRAAEGRHRIEAEVLASHKTILRAATEGDLDLFTGFLSGSDAEWATAQKQLVVRGEFIDRSAFGLDFMTDDPSVITPTLTFTPDLRSAELVARHRYVVADGEAGETIMLEHVTIFRRGPDRWLLSSPGPQFWGATETAEGRYVRLRYPSRDAVIAKKLAVDLDAVLADLCAGWKGRCPSLMVTLSTRADDLAPTVDPLRRLQGGEVTLPAPTLLGTPADEAGYRAFYREYAIRVVSAAVAYYTGWACCEDALFYSELLEAQLHNLGLRPWPATAENFERLIENPAVVDRLWEGRTVAPRHSNIWPIHALVDFLTREIDHVPILEMQRLLLAEDTLSYWDWIDQVTSGAFVSRNEFDRALLRYASDHRAVATPPIPLPDQDLQLVCWVGNALRPSLIRYDLIDGSHQREREFESPEPPAIVGLPSQNGIVVSSRLMGHTYYPSFIWRDGQATEIAHPADRGLGLVPLPNETDQSSLQFFPDVQTSAPFYALLPLETCEEEEPCYTQTVPGAMVFSPGHERTLISVGGPNPLSEDQWAPMLLLGDNQGRVVTFVGSGSSPFWLDDDTFGYVVLQGEGRQSVVVHDVLIDVGFSPADVSLADASQAPAQLVFVSNQQPPEVRGGSAGSPPGAEEGGPALSEARELFGTAQLENIPFLDPAADRTIDRVLFSPDMAGLYIVTGNTLQSAGPSYVIEYDLADGTMTARFSFRSEPLDDRRLYGFSPDGRWLVVGEPRQATSPDGGAVWELFLHGIGDLAPLGLTLNQTIVSESPWPADWLIDWSADGRWLALATNGYIRLVAPGENYTLPLILDDASCTAAVWVDNG
jgi:hypothetical protein